MHYLLPSPLTVDRIPAYGREPILANLEREVEVDILL